MEQPTPNSFVVSLRMAGEGQKRAAADLLPLVYDELRKLAAVRLVRSAPQVTLQPTALVHEAYVRLIEDGDPGWNGRGHFFGAAANAMRNILVDRAKKRAAIKHGGRLRRLGLDSIEDSAELAIDEIDFIGLDEALTVLESVSSDAAHVVMLRFFAGLSQAETAEVMGISVKTVRDKFEYARAWLHRRLAADAKT